MIAVVPSRWTLATVAAVAIVVAGLQCRAQEKQAAPPPATQPATRPAGEGTDPTAPRFDLEASDARAVAIADAVLEKLGGRRAWEQTRYVTWRFYRRRHLWDRHAMRLRLEGTGPATGKPYLMLLDLRTGEGRGWSGGEEVVEPADLRGMLDAGVRSWINDGYWLFMPFKLKDPGVTLRYRGEEQLPEGGAADVLELTFREVGVTPHNKYHVWVARDSGLPEQWAFFAEAGDDEPQWVLPWLGWKQHGGIMLASERGEFGERTIELADIVVFDELGDWMFERPDPVDWAALLER